MALRVRRSRLPYLLRKAKKTQSQLAEYLGVTQGFVSQVANNQAQLTYEMAANAAEFLKCGVLELVEWDRTP